MYVLVPKMFRQPGSGYKCAEKLEYYQCEFCFYQSSTKVSQSIHSCGSLIRPRVARTIQCCPLCKVESFSILWLYRHLKRYSCQVKKHIRKAKNSFKMYECDQCSMKYRLRRKLQIHKREKHVDNLELEFKCKKCSFATEMRRNFIYHIRSKHRTTGYKCPECDYVAHFKYHLTDHQYHKHTPKHLIKRLPCLYCASQFKRRGDLNRHIKQKHALLVPVLKQIICDQCGKRCTTPGLLQMHKLRQHHNEDFTTIDVV